MCVRVHVCVRARERGRTRESACARTHTHAFDCLVRVAGEKQQLAQARRVLVANVLLTCC